MDLTQSCQNLKSSDVKNNLDPGQATIVVFPDSMYTYRDTQGGSKLTNSSHSLFVTASS